MLLHFVGRLTESVGNILKNGHKGQSSLDLTFVILLETCFANSNSSHSPYTLTRSRPKLFIFIPEVKKDLSGKPNRNDAELKEDILVLLKAEGTVDY